MDYMPSGNPLDKHAQHRNTPLIQALGADFFLLLELVPLSEVQIKVSPGEVIELENFKDSLKVMKEPITFNDLTSTARGNIREAIERIIREEEKDFVEFFNKAQPITIKLHSLELIPSIGKKLVREILEERRKSPFLSFEDMEKRLSKYKIKPIEIIYKRIFEELQGNEKYYLFVYPYHSQGDFLNALGKLKRGEGSQQRS